MYELVCVSSSRNLVGLGIDTLLLAPKPTPTSTFKTPPESVVWPAITPRLHPLHGRTPSLAELGAEAFQALQHEVPQQLCVRACVRAYVRACVRAYVRACVSVCVCVCVAVTERVARSVNTAACQV